MSIFKSSMFSLAMLGVVAAGPAVADPVASAVSVVSFENFQVFWSTSGDQVKAADFSSLSVTSSQLTAANMTGQTGISSNPSSSTGADLVASSVLGTVDPSITGFPVTSTTVFNVPTLPMTGNFSASGSNETGSPIIGFFGATPNADLHNASYASLDTLNGTAGTSTSSQLASTMFFTSAVGGDGLTFKFDLGAYIGAYLSAGAAQTASAGWDVSFSLVNTAKGLLTGFYSTGDVISNNAPGSGTTEVGSLNAGLIGGLVDLTGVSFSTSSPIIAGDRYQLTATISTRTQVERRVPEPETLGLLGLGLAALGFMRRRRETA